MAGGIKISLKPTPILGVRAIHHLLYIYTIEATPLSIFDFDRHGPPDKRAAIAANYEVYRAPDAGP
jgi:hypothetical protein